MADPQKPGQGIIVRADFGGGIDQSADAWRVPPSQLSSLTNGRLDRAGSIRKRTGYQAVEAPPASSPNTGNPIAAISSKTQTVVIDRARDASLDNWTHPPAAGAVRIANECAYVARSYTPSTASSTNGWNTTGPVSDVIADVVMLDGNAGNIDECVDYGATADFFFVAKVTKAADAGSSTTLTLSQYDATTRTVISEYVQTFAGGAASATAARMYPKLLVYPTLSRIVLVAAYNSAAGFSTAQFNLISYAATGLALVASPAPTARMTFDHFDATAYLSVPEQRYRPVMPYDVAKIGDTGLFFAQYDTTAGAIRVERFTVAASTITSTANDDLKPAGVNALQALSIEPTTTDDGLALVGVSVTFNSALTPPYVTGNFQVPLVTINNTTCAIIAHNVNTITIPVAGIVAVPGRLTVGEYQAKDASELRVCGYAEILEYQSGFIYGHRLVRVGMGLGNATAADVTTYRSYAVPASRMFALTNYATVPSTDRRQLRLPLVVGSSQQTYLGRVSPSNVPYTNYTGNYSSNIGTQILVGTDTNTLTACTSPNQTIAPRLQPCPPPRAVQRGDNWYVPHLVALDGANGFGIALAKLTARASGDVAPGAYGDLPVFPGGVVQQTDGERCSEVTLVDRPTIGAIIGSNTGSATDFLPGDYLVQAVATYRDSAGNIHRSTPSDPYRHVQATAPNTPRRMQIWYSYQSFTARDDVQIEFYITDVNGTTPRYWFSVPNVPNAAYNAVNRDDSAIGGSGLPALDAPTIYTSGGTLPFVPVPSARFATLFKNRLIVGGADDPKSIYYSNPPLAYEAANFAVGNVIRLEHEAGCTGAGNVNDKLILFSPTGVYAVFGQFRDATGAGDALSEVESIHDYIGCTQPQSVISIPPGLIFFGSDSRFYLVDERLQLVPIGLKVQDFTAGTSMGVRLDQVRAVVHIESQREVRFYMADSYGGGPGGALVYNYQVDQWSRDFTLAATFPTAAGACWSSHLSCFIVSSAGWSKDDGTTYLDGSSWIALNAQTAWIQPGGTQDYARFRYCQILGRSAADHNLTVKVYTDFDPSTVRSTATWTAAQLAPIPDTVWPEQVKLQIGNQKTQSVKIEIYDAAPSGATSGQGPQLVGLALELLPLGGVKRLPATRKQ